jgi:hypothetical protein
VQPQVQYVQPQQNCCVQQYAQPYNYIAQPQYPPRAHQYYYPPQPQPQYQNVIDSRF